MHEIRVRGISEPFTAGKILCLGQNYAAHAREMKSDVPTTPIVFLKPASAIIGESDAVVIPPISREVHHEVELVVLIGSDGRNIPRSDAYGHIAGYGVGLDMTLRDLQREARKNGQPWAVAKGFDTSAPLSEFVPAAYVKDPQSLAISLAVNGIERQRSNTRAMIFPIDELVAYLSTIFTLERGDLIFTGTPEGVGPVVHGDVLRAEIESIGSLTVRVH